jgi:phosphonate metabolism protein (transferase hexapeptide repeat family)
VGAGCHLNDSTLGDYSYCVENTQIAYASIGKFSNIASHVRIYASKHPMQLASLHHFTYRSSWYFDDIDDNKDFFDWRASNGISIGHDTWIGHGAVIMPGVTVGNGAIVGSNAVVTRDVAPYMIAVGVPAKPIRSRFDDVTAARMEALAWWDWPHQRLHDAMPDFRTLSAADFLDKYEG